MRRADLTGVCLIIDQDHLRHPPDQVMRDAVRSGIGLFQYRSKSGTRRAVYETALLLSRTAKELGVLLIVNDHADIAVAVDANGVHLGQDDLPIDAARRIVGSTRVIGISTHSREQAQEAEQAGADYIGFGPVFATATKDAGKLQGKEGVAAVRKAVHLPLIAIGGIGPANAAEVMAAGADCVAVISALLAATDIGRASTELVNIVRGARSENSFSEGGTEI